MASRRQQLRRKHIYIGYLAALLIFAAWFWVSGWAEAITTEHSVSYNSQR